MQTAIVIPARFASTRLPGKMLLNETGMPLIQHTWQQAKKAQGIDRVLVATDDQRIFDLITGLGGEAMMTDPVHENGTSRLAEVARNLKGVDTIINVQGDEPEIEPAKIEMLAELFATADAEMGTLVVPFPAGKTEGPGSPADPNCCKAVLGAPVKDRNGKTLGQQALYFSRSLVPFPRDDAGAIKDPTTYYLHLGIYAYRPAFLQTYSQLPAAPLESIEKLEQLRVLENGYKIVAGVADKATPGVDTRADYDAFLARWNQQKGA